MKLKRKTLLKLKKSAVITLWFMAAGFISSIVILYIRPLTPISKEYEISFLNIILTNLNAGFLAGIFFSAVDLFLFDGKFRNYSFSKVIIIKTVIFFIMFFIVMTVVSFIFHSTTTGEGLFSEKTIEGVIVFYQTPGPVINLVIWGTILFATNFVLQVSRRFGYGVLTKYILGKYHSPIQEERIFMFLDLRSSTSIAENLGSIKYYNFLNDFFYDASSTVLYSLGEVYQYVGDEMVVSWKLNKGLKNANYLRCFFDTKNVISAKAESYRKKYNLIPEFKAGFHFGTVTAGEIGGDKIEIVYSGDVLNTASRIQGECNKYGTDILVSKELIEKTELPDEFEPVKIDDILFRGKSKQITLFTISKK